MRLYEPLVLLLSNHFIYITEAVANQFSLKGFKKKGVVIHDGIPVEEYSAKPETPGEKIVLTSVGRLAPYKGQDVLLKAIANVIRLNIDLETYIVGEVYGNRHEFREELNNLAASLDLTNKVHFMGFYENVQPFLEKCNIFILPSTRQEPLGIVMLEAMAARRAVIATDGGGAREIITDGEDGLLVPPGDSHRMAEAIIRLVKNPEERRRLATFGYEKVNKKFSEKVMVDAVLALFENIIIKKNNSEV